MLELSELQARFSAALLDPVAEALAEWICSNDIAASRRLAIYRNNCRISHAEALAGIYPAINQLVGERFFERLAEEYDRRHPSTSGDLRQYGSELAQFLSVFEPAAQLPYLPDVARLEWAWHECFHAAAGQSVEPADLADLAARLDGDTGLSLIPAARLLASPYPAADIWAFALDPDRQEDGLDLGLLKEARLLIARREERVEVMELTPPQFFWLDKISRHDSLAVVFQQTLTRYPEFDLRTELATFVRLGVLSKELGRNSPVRRARN